MSRNKYWLLAVGFVVVSGLSGGFLLRRTNTKKHQLQTPANVQGAYTELPLTQTSDAGSIPLNQTQPKDKSSGGLSVAPNSTANNLGQLTPNSDGATSSNAPSSGAPKTPDPATFSQYDKYKDGDSALFGDMQVGTGDELTADKSAAVYYKGWLTNGQLFDATHADKDGKLQPFVFDMDPNKPRQVIPGWKQGLLGMKVGGTRLVIVPPSVGYGAAGQDPIPGNAVLVFQVQLLAVQ